MAQKKQTQPRKSNFLVKCTGESKNKQYSWRLVAANGKITASGTGLNKKPGKAYVENLVKQLQNCTVQQEEKTSEPLSKSDGNGHEPDRNFGYTENEDWNVYNKDLRHAGKLLHRHFIKNKK